MNNKQNKSAVHDLQFNVAQLLKEATGASREYDVNTKILNELDGDVTLISPIVGHVRFLRTGSDILVTGVLESTVQKTCGRCLNTFITPLTVELEEQFYPTVDILSGGPVPSPPDEDEANRIDAQHILDLLEVVRQNFLLESDGIRYCRPECKGLCPHCGKDRNVEPCTCEDEKIDLRWAALQTFEIDD